MSDALQAIIARAAATQPLTIAQYMELALQHPEYGYYRRHDPLGARGDFITAPEISQTFGELIGLWCVDMWDKLGRPDPFTLCELGPGRGTLMRDALRAAGTMPAFTTACRVVLVESNVDLRTAQGAALADYQPQWLEEPDALPMRPALVIANEFFDALPIRQYIRREDDWYENCISCVAGKLQWAAVRVAVPVAAGMPAAAPGAIVEVSVAATNIMRDLSRHLAAHGGAMLAIDYGYDAAPGSPTFQALARHNYADPLRDPGQADLTAHVDFGALAATAREQGMQVWPLVTQGDFLRALGIDARCAQLVARATPAQRDALLAAHRRLTDSVQMGTLFKVFCVTPSDDPVPAGWE